MSKLQEAFRNHPTYRSELAGILNEPVMLDAIAIIREKCYEPRPTPVGASLIEWSALMGARREGYLECLTNFLSLASISPHRMPDRKPWEQPRDEKDKPTPFLPPTAEPSVKE